MKKLSMMALAILFVGVVSCRDEKKEQQELDATLDKIESVELEMDNTLEEVEKKAEEVESALSELDSL